MTLTVDASGFLASLDRLAAQLPVTLAAGLPGTAEEILIASAYAEPTEDEAGPGPEAATLISPVQTDGEIFAVEVAVLYDWVLGEPRTTHCHDCLEFARLGPYTIETLPAEPGDGTTECGPNCYCQLVPREVDLSTAAEGPLSDLAATALAASLGTGG